ncbi:MAG: hypothetical protein Satyrvirus34_5 [Satyrvirus sp.]|uniref:Uncharacterized protein n=1 Tax=Satyrvirus sp. TaxID=2487771 RepID=A0A3G5AET1_9VIRU|nr:MAG: hypothetical protein Satyrvirus34_5 [Satyrvirus sp.]
MVNNDGGQMKVNIKRKPLQILIMVNNDEFLN